MSNTSLNDLIYSFESIKIVEPDENYQVDEKELEKSIQKSKEMMKVVENYKKRRAMVDA